MTITIILIIILILLSTNNTEYFLEYDIDLYKSNKINVSNINNITSFSVPLPLSELKTPSPNSSTETIKELKDLVKFTAKRSKSQKLFFDNLNKIGIKQYWINYINQNGLKYSPEYLDKLYQDLDNYLNSLKFVYNRPRPKLLAYLLSPGYNLDIKSKLENTPSYPSKSTCISKVIAYVLIKSNPEKASEISALAKKIELINLYSGTHYKSDLDASNYISEIIQRNLKYS